MSKATIADVVDAIKAPSAAKDWAPNIVSWGDLYAAVPKTRSIELLTGSYTRNVRSLRMATQVCRDWAALCWTENSKVEADGDVETAFLEEHLGERFAPRFSNLLEGSSFARGIAALEVMPHGLTMLASGEVVRDSETRITVETVPADCFIPLRWERDEIVEAAVVTYRDDGFDVREHRDSPLGRVIVNRSFDKKGEGRAIEREVDEGTAPMLLLTGAPRMFAAIRPAINNNLDQSSPYGVSVFANAVDDLTTLDTIYDNFGEDFELGGKMVFVPDTMLRHDEQGNIIPPQRDKQNLFVPLQGEVGIGGGAAEVKEHNPLLRVEENTAGIEAALGILSMKVGMGAGRYRYREGSVTTATQIVSENSDLFRNRARHLLAITDALVSIAHAALWCGANLAGLPLDPEVEVTVNTDDSVIEDDGARHERGMRLFQAGAISQRTFLIDYLKMGEDEADAEVERSKVVAAPLF